MCLLMGLTNRLNRNQAIPAALKGSGRSPPSPPKGRSPVEIIATVEQPRFSQPPKLWQAADIKPVEACGVKITSIVGETSIVLSRFLHVKVCGTLRVWRGKYQLEFTKCETVAAEYRNPILTILARAGVPKARGEVMEGDLGEDFAHKIVADPSHIRRLFPRIKEPGTKAILAACQKAVAGNEIFQALNAVGAPQDTIDAAAAFDLETQDVYNLIERGLPFARADAPAQHQAIQALQPFDKYSPARIAHAAKTEIKKRCGLWGHTGLPLADILGWGRTDLWA